MNDILFALNIPKRRNHKCSNQVNMVAIFSYRWTFLQSWIWDTLGRYWLTSMWSGTILLKVVFSHKTSSWSNIMQSKQRLMALQAFHVENLENSWIRSVSWYFSNSTLLLILVTTCGKLWILPVFLIFFTLAMILILSCRTFFLGDILSQWKFIGYLIFTV